MTVKKCDLNLFQVFDTIYTERNLTHAARSLSITQPAVSNALARLRKLFDDELFVRTARGMMPTPVAESIAQNVSEALALLRRSARYSPPPVWARSEEHTSELQSREKLVCRLMRVKK